MCGLLRKHCFLTLLAMLATGSAFAQAQNSPKEDPNYFLEEDETPSVATPTDAAVFALPDCPNCDPADAPGDGITVSLLNPANRLRITAGLDTLAVMSSKRTFPSGTPLFLLPDSPFGLDTNSFDVHARQSYVGAVYSGPQLGDFQVGGQMLAFLQNHDLSADDYGLLVYYAFAELKNDQWRFATGLQQDVFNPVSPTIVYLTKMYASGNTGSYRGQLRAERFFQEGDDFGVTVQTALSEPLSTLVTSGAGRITEDNGWPSERIPSAISTTPEAFQNAERIAHATCATMAYHTIPRESSVLVAIRCLG